MSPSLSDTLLTTALAGERIVAISPGTARDAAVTWQRHPNFFAGRALTTATLAQRQQWQEGRVTSRGQGMVCGVEEGLEVSFELRAELVEGDAPAPVRVQLRVEPGRALTADGEDVVLSQALECPIDAVQVFDPLRSDRLSDLRLPQWLAAHSDDTAAPVGVLLLQPVRVDVGSFDPTDPSDRTLWRDSADLDPTAVEDWRSLDGARLVWFPWLASGLEFPGGAPEQWRNALAWSVFRAEATLGEGQRMPWEAMGTPIGLVALDAANAVPLWADRASVVRRGVRVRDTGQVFWQERLLGRAGSSVRAIGPGSRLDSLRQAQFEQLAEQMAAEAGAGNAADTALMATRFADRLPPFGLLPRTALEAVGTDAGMLVYRSGFFPPHFDLDIAPVPVEQLEAALRGSAALEPLNPDRVEAVRLLVPVPFESWEPRLLLRERVDPEFQSVLDAMLLKRARTLGLRQGLRQRGALLTHALSGQVLKVPSYRDDPLALEVETLPPWGPPPPGGGHRSTLRAGLHQHFFDNTTAPLRVNRNERLFVWACLDPDAPPRSLMFKWHTRATEAVTAHWTAAACWGDPPTALGAVVGGSERLNARALPESNIGVWVRLDVPVAELGLVDGTELDGMAFIQHDGRVAYGLVGAATGNDWRKWFCNFLPTGARVQGDEPWELLTANDLWMPFELRGGVVPSLPELGRGAGASDPFGTGGQQQVGDNHLAIPSGGHNLVLPAAIGWRGALISYFQHAGRPEVAAMPLLPRQAGHKLQWWAYLDELQPPRALAVVYMVGGASPGSAGLAGSKLGIAYWGENRLDDLYKLFGWSAAKLKEQSYFVPPLRAGALPRTGSWVSLEFGLPDGTGMSDASNMKVLVALPMAFDGVVAFGDLTQLPAGVSTAQRIWPLPGQAGGGPFAPFAPFPPASKVRLQNNLGVLTPTPSSRIGTVVVSAGLVEDPTLGKLSPHEQSQLQLRGLQGFADYLRTRIDRADDITDFGFAHMQVDLHRIRQMMLSTSDASRLAVSPALAAIAKSDSALTVQTQIRDYISSVKNSAEVVPPAVPGQGVRATAVQAATVPATQNASASWSAAAAVRQFARVGLIAPTRARAEIVYSMPVIGLSEVRTAAIAERLRTPPSTEARDYALANRQRTVKALLDLLDGFLREDSDETPALLLDFTIPGLAGDAFLSGSHGQPRPLTDFRSDPRLLDNLLTPPPFLRSDGKQLDESEATLFTQTVALSDITVAILRQLESRLTIYRDALMRCESALVELREMVQANVDRIAEVDEDLAESRHDVSVARALLQEEEDRVAAVNARRRKVLDEEVKFLAYMRPREVDNLLATPTHAVDPGLMEAPVPACLREHPDVPEELLDMLRVVREAPARWFVKMPALVQKLDRHEPLIRALHSAQQRALAGLAMPLLTAARDNSKLAAAVLKVSGRQAETLGTKLSRLQSLSLNQLKPLSWQAIRQEAEEVLSFADLADGGHGRADVAKAAATELDQIRSIVACLHAEFCAVPAIVRLGWAQLLSEFDEAPNLRNLASLPRWPEIGFIDRRQMQSYVDWLFDQIEPGQPQAVALINDVVRMCLLLASHAPVDRIVAGRMARPVTGVSLGQRIPLTVLDPAQLRIGMQAVIYRGGQVVARAQVEDLGQGEVAARVIHKATERLDLGDDCKVHFDREAAVSLSSASARRSLFGR